MKVVRPLRGMTYKDWQADRVNGIGGSEIGAIMGLSQYSSPIMVFVSKVAPEEMVVEEKESMYWGRELEHIVKREFVKRMKAKGVNLKVERYPYIVCHDDYPWARANLDYRFTDEEGKWGVLECKTANEYSKHDWETGKVPDSYYAQVNWYLGITGYDYAYLAVLIGGNEFLIFKIEKNQEFFDKQLATGITFWEYNVKERRMPEPIGNPGEDKYLGLAEGAFLADDPFTAAEIVKLLEQRDEIADVIDQLDTEKKRLATLVAQKMGGRKRAELNGWKISNDKRFTITPPKEFHSAVVSLQFAKAYIARNLIYLKEAQYVDQNGVSGDWLDNLNL